MLKLGLLGQAAVATTVYVGAVLLKKGIETGVSGGAYSPGTGAAMSLSTPGEITGGYRHASGSKGKTGVAPNPNGKKGGKEHQEVNQTEAARMENAGKDVTPEVKIPTPDGKKKTRFVDQVGTDPKTGEKEMVQVGKQEQKWNSCKKGKRCYG